MALSPVKRSNASRGRSVSPVRGAANRARSAGAASTTTTTTPDSVYVFQHPLTVLRHRPKLQLSMPTSRTIRSWSLTAAIISVMLILLLNRLSSASDSSTSSTEHSNTKSRKEAMFTPSDTISLDAGDSSSVLERLNQVEKRMNLLLLQRERQEEEDAKRRLGSSLSLEKETKALHSEIAVISKRIRSLEEAIQGLPKLDPKSFVSADDLRKEQDLQWSAIKDYLDKRVNVQPSHGSNHIDSNSLIGATEQVKRFCEERINFIDSHWKTKHDIFVEKVTEKIDAISATERKAALDDNREGSLVFVAVNKSLELFREDGGVARADFALVSGGASVIRSLTSHTYWGGSSASSEHSLLTRLFMNTAVTQRPPEEALSPNAELGSCWPCKLGDCRLAVKLSTRVRVKAVSLEHLAQSLSVRPSSEGDTAPKDFVIYGLADDGFRKSELGFVFTVTLSSSVGIDLFLDIAKRLDVQIRFRHGWEVVKRILKSTSGMSKDSHILE